MSWTKLAVLVGAIVVVAIVVVGTIVALDNGRKHDACLEKFGWNPTLCQ